MRTLLAIAAAAALTGCAVLSEPRPEPMSVQPAWRAVPVQAAPFEAEWWRALGDPVLDGLVAEAQQRNADVKLAATRVAQARALGAAARAETRPSVGIGVRADRRRYPSQRYPGFDEPAPASTFNQIGGGIEASYEIDLFGRLAKGLARAQDELRASESDARTVELAVTYDVVAAYAEARAAGARIRTARELAATAARLGTTEARLVKAGVATQRDAREAEDIVGAAEVTVAFHERDRADAIARLALLLGKAPIDVVLPDHAVPLDAARVQVGADLPASVIERRPDVQAAWHRLSAATTDIERARLERYPRITLTGALGFASNELHTWLVRNALAWALGAGASMPIVDGGRIEARTAFAVAVRDEYAVAYRRTVIAALTDVERALATWQAVQVRNGERSEALTRRLRDLEAVERAIRAGRTDERQRIRDRIAMLAAEDALAATALDRVLAYAAVRHALAQ